MRKSEKLMKIGGIAQIIIAGIIIALEIFKIFGIELINILNTPFNYIPKEFKIILCLWVIFVSFFELLVGFLNLKFHRNFNNTNFQITINIALLFSKSFSSEILTTLATICTLTGAFIKNKTAKKNISNNEATLKEK